MVSISTHWYVSTTNCTFIRHTDFECVHLRSSFRLVHKNLKDSKLGRGLNAVTLDGQTLEVKSIETFDTYAEGKGTKNCSSNRWETSEWSDFRDLSSSNSSAYFARWGYCHHGELRWNHLRVSIGRMIGHFTSLAFTSDWRNRHWPCWRNTAANWSKSLNFVIHLWWSARKD